MPSRRAPSALPLPAPAITRPRTASPWRAGWRRGTRSVSSSGCWAISGRGSSRSPARTRDAIPIAHATISAASAISPSRRGCPSRGGCSARAPRPISGGRTSTCSTRRRGRPLDEQRHALHDPELRRKLVASAAGAEYSRGVGADTRRPDFDWIFLMEDPTGPHRSVAELARERGLDPVETLILLALERDLRAFFVQPLANENLDHVLEMMRHPRSVVTFSDSGAHVSQIMDSS